MEQRLSDLVTLKRRYTRSINLERDLSIVDSVLGYIPTSWTLEACSRIFPAFSNEHSMNAWTITGVYGTGKSAFAHFLASLLAAKNDPMTLQARHILQQYLGPDHPLCRQLATNIPDTGFIRAVATAQREPLSYTIIRALNRGCELFWAQAYEQHPVRIFLEAYHKRIHNQEPIASQDVLTCLQYIFLHSGTSILLIIDELGKSLEYAAWHQESEDLYLLQQLAELPSRQQTGQVYVIGLLHQSFTEYAQNVTKLQRNEWSKVQGRFEDILFVTANAHMLHLIGQAIDYKPLEALDSYREHWSQHWEKVLYSFGVNQEQFSQQDLAHLYPLQPLAALVLPTLCNRYAQNDRSLFTFLTSQEPHSFATFLTETSWQGPQTSTLKLHRIYDYFIEASNIASSTRVSHQRWIEVQHCITDAEHLDTDLVLTLKTIGLLNLVDSGGVMRATRQMVLYALADDPLDEADAVRWESAIQALVKRGLVTYRKQLDELRIWEGSDFDIEQAISARLEAEQEPLSSILGQTYPLTPTIAQKHSYITGTLRYFERYYADANENLMRIRTKSAESVGVIVYWLNEDTPENCPKITLDNKPLILLCGSNIARISAVSREYAALTYIEANTPQLQSDGVARREVRQRLTQLRHLLNDLLMQSFLSGNDSLRCYSGGNWLKLDKQKDFQRHLSDICKKQYDRTPVLWNELLNRNELTSQGAKARRELLEAMLTNVNQERLGLQGNGPEASMYMSVLRKTGIHRYIQDQWLFTEPLEPTIHVVWQAMEQFCLQAKSQAVSLDQLYQQLEAPPYGMKKGPIPVLLAAVLLVHTDDISIYQDGTFIPQLRADHFELLVKQPGRFSVKYFEIAGLRMHVFRELAMALRGSKKLTLQSPVRNSTVLSIVKPLIQFGDSLPPYTLKTKHLSAEAIAVREALRDAREPDELLFTVLPQACGLQAISPHSEQTEEEIQHFKQTLIHAIQELQFTYEKLIGTCKNLLFAAFKVRSDLTKLQEDLRVRAQYIKEHCIELQMKSFLVAAANEGLDERSWLEALCMIVADKPVVSWSDEDLTRFEVRLSDLARRFAHLEAIQRELDLPMPSGFDVQRITITQPNGLEDHHMLWLDQEHQEMIGGLVERILNQEDLAANTMLQQELVAALVQKVFRSDKKTVIQSLTSHGKGA